jgi:hypothetical protein
MKIHSMIYRSRVLLTLGILITLASGAIGQNLTFLSAVWRGSYREWHMLDEEENQIGEIRLTWGLGDNWTSWTISSEEMDMELRQKWADDPNTWEANINGRWIEARTLFPNRLDAWRIKYADEQYVLEQAWLGKWRLRRSDLGSWEMEQYYPGDPRDWVIIKESLDWPLELETFISMLVIIHQTPRE